ncbi:MAG: hypothetical protein ACREV6_07005 [Clostridium sp.]|uniref:hypothetical protein n=1 Tax=Clostridium sp. TaxID=1506 RepID=UPI003D6C9866
MGQVKNSEEDVLILKKTGDNNTDTNTKTISRLLVLEIDYINKIEKVLAQYIIG